MSARLLCKSLFPIRIQVAVLNIVIYNFCIFVSLADMASNFVMLALVKVDSHMVWPIHAGVNTKIGRKAQSHIKLSNCLCAGDHAIIKWDGNGHRNVELISLDDNTFADGRQVESGSEC